MARRGRPTHQITLSAEERSTLERWARRHNSSQALALRCRIVLAAASGDTNQAIAARLGVNQVTVSKWRRRFAADRLDGLGDAPRPGAACSIGDDVEHRLMSLLHQSQLDQHDGSVSFAAQARVNRARKGSTGQWWTLTLGECVTEVPGPPSPSYRGRVPKLSPTCRSHCVHYEPGSHNTS